MSKPSVVLALDTSTEQCSVALQVGQHQALRSVLAPREHSQKILPFIDSVLAEFNVTLADVERIIVGHGPGSFTGVRIGVSIAQGLAFSQQIPVTPVSTLAALAQQAIRLRQATAVVAAIDARMNEVYIARYEARDGLAVVVEEPQMAPLTALDGDRWWPQPSIGVGTGWQAYEAQLAPAGGIEIATDITLPLAEDMLSLGLQANANSIAAADLEPLYVRNEVAWKKLPGR